MALILNYMTSDGTSLNMIFTTIKTSKIYEHYINIYKMDQTAAVKCYRINLLINLRKLLICKIILRNVNIQAKVLN